MNSRNRLMALAGASALALLASSAAAQDYSQVAPKEPKPAVPQVALPWPFPQKPQAPRVARKLLIQELIGLSFVDDPKKIQKNGVRLYGLKAEPSLYLLTRSGVQGRLAHYLGRPLYTTDLQAISQIVTDWYRAHGLPLVEVTYPEQDVTTGTVQILVTLFRVGKVRVQGNKWFSSGVLKDEMELEPGDPFDFDELKDDLDRLNRNPFREATAVLERSTVPGTTDLDVRVEDRLPVRVYASYDDDGLPVTGRDRYSLGFNWGDVFGLDQQFSYQFITSPDLLQKRDRGAGHSDAPRFMAHSANYLVPLPWGDSLTLFGTYVQQVPNLGANFDQVGTSLQISGRYDETLPSIAAFTETLHWGFDYKRSNNNLSFGGTSIFAAATDIDQFLLIYDAARPDAYGQTTLENQFVYSPGGFAGSNTTSVFVASGVNGAKANYEYDNLSVTRVTMLPWNASTVLKVNGQLASTELLPSEGLGAGGPDSVRGYNPRAANGTQGVLASLELRSPSYGLLHALLPGIADSGQVLAFFDSGFVGDLNNQQNQPKHASLESAGGGVRYGIGRYLDARFDYGVRLATAAGEKRGGGLANFSVTLSY